MKNEGKVFELRYAGETIGYLTTDDGHHLMMQLNDFWGIVKADIVDDLNKVIQIEQFCKKFIENEDFVAVFKCYNGLTLYIHHEGRGTSNAAIEIHDEKLGLIKKVTFSCVIDALASDEWKFARMLEAI